MVLLATNFVLTLKLLVSFDQVLNPLRVVSLLQEPKFVRLLESSFKTHNFLLKAVSFGLQCVIFVFQKPHLVLEVIDFAAHRYCGVPVRLVSSVNVI